MSDERAAGPVRRVAVSGAGAVSGFGWGVDALWEGRRTFPRLSLANNGVRCGFARPREGSAALDLPPLVTLNRSDGSVAQGIEMLRGVYTERSECARHDNI